MFIHTGIIRHFSFNNQLLCVASIYTDMLKIFCAENGDLKLGECRDELRLPNRAARAPASMPTPWPTKYPPQIEGLVIMDIIRMVQCTVLYINYLKIRM